MIAVRNVSKYFGRNCVLESVSFELSGGTLTALVGGNGAGKSTLLKIMTGASAATTGVVDVGPTHDRIETILDAKKAGVGASFQEGSLIPAWKVGEHFAKSASPGDAPWKSLIPDVRASSLVCELEQSERQLLEIARAAASSPQALLADEPTAGLAGPMRDRIVRTLRAAANDGSAVLWVTHDLQSALASADRILVLRAGRLVRDTSPSAISMTELLGEFATPSDEPSGKSIRVGRSRPKLDPARLTLIGIPIFRGEVLGIVGSPNVRISDAMRSAAGLTAGSGFIYSRGRWNNESVRYVSRERSTEWLLDKQDVLFNLVAGSFRRLSKLGFRRRVSEHELGSQLAARFAVSSPSLSSPIETLSGGNRQKVVLARMTASMPEVLLLDEPYSGVDAPTRSALRHRVHEIAATGTAVVIHSNELSDLRESADRLIAVRQLPTGVEWCNITEVSRPLDAWLYELEDKVGGDAHETS